MENANQNIIAQLQKSGLSEHEIQSRLMRLKMSTGGTYDPFTDSFTDLADYSPNEPQNVAKSPETMAAGIPHLKTAEELDQDFLSRFELDPSIKDEPIDFCFEHDGIAFCPKGDVQAIKAPQKNGKTFLLTLLMGAALRGEYLGVRCLVRNPRVLYVDTEQHPRNTRQVFRRVCLIAGIDGYVKHENLNMLSLRMAESVEDIKKAIHLKVKYFQPDIVCLDGLVDLLYDFNDLRESKEVVTEISKMALEHNCCVLAVLHTNPSDETKMRGHVGTILSQKASDVVLCRKQQRDDGASVFSVEQTDARNNANFNKFQFAVELRKNPQNEYIAVPVPAYVSMSDKTALDQLFRWALAKEPLRRADLRDKITSDECPHKVSRSTAYSKINDALQAKIICDDDPVTCRLRYVGQDKPKDEL